jgi:hypothetical protein
MMGSQSASQMPVGLIALKSEQYPFGSKRSTQVAPPGWSSQNADRVHVSPVAVFSQDARTDWPPNVMQLPPYTGGPSSPLHLRCASHKTSIEQRSPSCPHVESPDVPSPDELPSPESPVVVVDSSPLPSSELDTSTPDVDSSTAPSESFEPLRHAVKYTSKTATERIQRRDHRANLADDRVET